MRIVLDTNILARAFVRPTGLARALNAAILVSPQFAPRVVPADPLDDPIVATAIEGSATELCTRDSHLYAPAVVQFCAAHGIGVLDDISLIHRLRAASTQNR